MRAEIIHEELWPVHRLGPDPGPPHPRAASLPDVADVPLQLVMDLARARAEYLAVEAEVGRYCDWECAR